MEWLLRARPADYALALSVAGASLPVVGKHLEPLGGVTAMGVWGVRHAPETLSTMVKDLLTPGINDVRRRDRECTRGVSVAALRGVVSAADLDGEWPTADCTPPIWDALRQRRYLYRRAVHYGKHPAQVLDVWRRKDLPAQPAPVLVFLPGGAWVHGRCVGQGSALMSRLAQQGWVCLAVDYRAAPHYRWPRHIVDVKTAIAWARAAPPFLVIHGRRDSVIPVDQARSFGERLRGVSHAKVGYLELPGAGHAFDLIDGERAGEMAHATALFLNQVYRSKTQIGAKEVI